MCDWTPSANTGDVTRELEEAIRQIPEIVSCHYISGTGTFELQVVSRDLNTFSQFAREVLINLPKVKDLHTSFSLGEVKARWCIATPVTYGDDRQKKAQLFTKLGSGARHVAARSVQVGAQTPTLPPPFLVMTMVAERGRRRLAALAGKSVGWIAVASLL